MTKKLKKVFNQKGQLSRTLIILLVVIFIMAVIVYVVTRVIVSQRAKPAQTPEVPAPVYETTVNDVRFFFESAKDVGSIMYGKTSRFPSYQPNITTTDRFLVVKVRAQNKAKTNIPVYTWDIGNVIDGAGRNYVPISDSKAFSWLPFPDQCGALLKPEFQPTPCVKIYEISKASDTLSVEVIATDTNGKIKKSYIDLIVTK